MERRIRRSKNANKKRREEPSILGKEDKKQKEKKKNSNPKQRTEKTKLDHEQGTFSTNLSIEHTLVTHLRMNGQTEVTKGTLFQGIKKKLDRIKGLQADALPKILWASRTTARIITREYPPNLAFGTQSTHSYRGSIPSLLLVAYDPSQNDEALRANLDLLDEKRHQALIHLAPYKQKATKFHDK
ncbi:hypothetical protein RJ639_020167 [Escallonia herrerae]|uniref:Uncharacterized protein n=1 Tax=Escallonia herrerae TaxID=1293975 RepID=A0AA89AIQ5_9ASTE|nr:hypothetical protein RJ639_020167 [Escallonia herrerae]